MSEQNELKRLAELATPGPWYAEGQAVTIDTRFQICCGRSQGECCGDPEVEGEYRAVADKASPDDAAFIAAANPAVILKLLDRIEALERRVADERIKELAHDAWVKTNSWNLTRDEFIKLSYFHGCMDSGSDGKGPVNGSEDRPGDTVYISPTGSSLSRAMVSYWLADHNSFVHGYFRAMKDSAVAAAPKEPTT
jgi:hypothetical protein